MGGIYISCGSFQGDDKSGSAIEGVLDDLVSLGSDTEKRLLEAIRSQLGGGADHAVIEVREAQALLPLLQRYRQRTAARIAPITDPAAQIEKDQRENPSLDPTEAKYGKSLGWRYYCTLDLERACVVASDEAEPVILTWD